jgi:hypothetical protein
MWQSEAGELYVGFWWEDLIERDHGEDLGVDGRITIKMDPLEVGGGSMDWIGLAQGRDRWRVHKRRGSS